MSTHVLVIDDDSATRKLVRFILEDAEYVVLEAADAATALDLLHTSSVGLVVLFDYRMPRLDGAELMALAEREQLLAQRHSFVCITASPQSLPPALSDLLTRYDVPLVGKPFRIDELLAVIAHAEQRLTPKRQT